jgi:hypothetical protein
MARSTTALDLLVPGVGADLGALMSEARRQQMVALAGRFPVPTHAVGFECRLSADDDRVDYNLAFFGGAGLTAELAVLRTRLGADGGWSRLIALLERWSAGRDWLSAQVPFVCFAFDEDSEDLRWLPIPCVSFCVDAEFYARRLGARVTPVTLATVESVAELCADALNEAPLEEPVRERLKAVMSTDDGVEARHLSVMLARREPVMKLDVRLPRENVARFLSRAYPAALVEAATAGIATLQPDSQDVQLNVALQSGGTPVVESEFLTGRADGSWVDRSRLLERLVEQGLACEAKAHALRQVLERPVIFVDAQHAVARSWYIKVRYFEDGYRDAKAYLGFMPHAAAPLLPHGSSFAAQGS